MILFVGQLWFEIDGSYGPVDLHPVISNFIAYAVNPNMPDLPAVILFIYSVDDE